MENTAFGFCDLLGIVIKPAIEYTVCIGLKFYIIPNLYISRGRQFKSNFTS